MGPWHKCSHRRNLFNMCKRKFVLWQRRTKTDGVVKIDSTIKVNNADILEIYKDQKEKIWAAYPNHIRTLNSKNEIVIPFHHRVMSLMRVDDKLFIGSENGLFEYDIKSQKTKKVIF